MLLRWFGAQEKGKYSGVLRAVASSALRGAEGRLARVGQHPVQGVCEDGGVPPNPWREPSRVVSLAV